MEYDGKVVNMELSPTDRRDVAGLKAKFSKERKMLADHLAKKLRMQ